jgi:hypothetical protein
MTLLSAAEDLELRTFGSLPNVFARLLYLEGLYEDSGFRHWGLERVHGAEASSAALRDVYRKQVADLVSRDLRSLWTEWMESESLGSCAADRAGSYGVADARRELSPIRAQHLNLVFETLAALEAAHPPKRAA